jgi:hypothetical protein
MTGLCKRYSGKKIEKKRRLLTVFVVFGKKAPSNGVQRFFIYNQLTASCENRWRFFLNSGMTLISGFIKVS